MSRKKWLVTGIIILVIITGALLYLKFRKSADFESLIKAKLQQVVKDGSNGLYTLQIDKIEVDVLRSSIHVLNAHLLIDSARLKNLELQEQAPNDVYKISLKALSINGISPADFISQKNITLTTVSVSEPVVEIFHHKRAYNYKPADTATFYSRIAKEVGHFKLGDLQIQHINFTYHNIAKKDKIIKFPDVSLHFKEIEIDSLTQYDSTRFLYAKDAAFFLKKFSLKTPDSLYVFTVDSMALQANGGIMNLKGLSLQPRGKKENFSEKLKFYKDRFDIHIENALIKHIDWYHLLSEDGFTASEAFLSEGVLEVFADKSLPSPGKNKVGNYPHQMLMKLDFPVQIGKTDIKDFRVTYKEYSPVSKKTGAIVFDRINGTITNLTNQAEQIAVNSLLTLDAHTHLMNAVPVHTVFTFNLAKVKDGAFALDMDLKDMDGTLLNTMTIPVGLFEIKSATIHRLKTHIDAGNYQAKGSVTFLYDDLKIDVLKPDENEPDKVKKRGLVSFFAKTFILKQSNPSKGKPASVQHVSAKRDPYKSFFNLIWIIIRTGLIDTVKGK